MGISLHPALELRRDSGSETRASMAEPFPACLWLHREEGGGRLSYHAKIAVFSHYLARFLLLEMGKQASVGLIRKSLLTLRRIERGRMSISVNISVARIAAMPTTEAILTGSSRS